MWSGQRLQRPLASTSTPRPFRRGRFHIEPKIISPTGLRSSDLDPDALRAVQRLHSRGHEVYLVGGCVRDLLLGRHPKDFDIATSARPQQVKRTFPRNCRIIGRRFKLAHLHFHNNQKILEVATFRKAPEQGDDEDGDDLLITRDNEFGSAEEDALRRDFTINALLFDPIEDQILDWANGLADLEARTLRTIGDPLVRFREDPVRILRAAKFAGRIGLHIADDAWAAMIETAPDLARSAPPRILEEILRLLRGGHALPSFQILRDTRALGVMLPQIGEFLDTAPLAERRRFWRLLDALDRHTLAGNQPTSAVLLGVLFERVIAKAAAAAPRKAATTIAENILAPVAQDLRLPRRDAGSLKRICGVQQRFAVDGGRRYKLSAFLHDPYLAEALELFELSCIATGSGFEQLAQWRERAEAERGPLQEAAELPELRWCTPDDERPVQRSHRTDSARSRRGRGADQDRSGRQRNRDGTDAKESTRDRSGRRGGATESRRAERSDSPADARGKSRRGGKKKTKAAAEPKARSAKPGKGKGDASKQTRPKDQGRTRDNGKRGKKRRDDVATIEPASFDLSAFDSELDPTRRAPTFGALVEGQQDSKGKKRRGAPKIPDVDRDTYKPPPPPGSGDGPSPPPPPPGGGDGDNYGDW